LPFFQQEFGFVLQRDCAAASSEISTKTGAAMVAIAPTKAHTSNSFFMVLPQHNPVEEDATTRNPRVKVEFFGRKFMDLGNHNPPDEQNARLSKAFELPQPKANLRLNPAISKTFMPHLRRGQKFCSRICAKSHQR
jgi:hypothetical protein